ncbi:MAG: MBL fold metallo-hydrolase [Bacteroidales bacterium]|nr:MBL fold metallo-hydrolase [Bacteroidales bacterium]
MVKFFSLSSGSNGNCYYIGNEETGLLIDAGIGPRTIKKRLQEQGISMDNIDFLLVTHDHIDHIKGLGMVAQKYYKPVYATEKLHASLDNHPCTRCRLSGCVRKTLPGMPSSYKGVTFTPFVVPHDATETVGYHIDFYGKKFTFITDVGAVTDDVIKYCKMSQIVIFESNYDLDMLLAGSYTPELKVRIVQGQGHLSNEQAASAVKRFWHKNLTHLFLCHLSENNNTPALAHNAISAALRSAGAIPDKDTKLVCLPRRSTSEVYEF